MVEESLVLPSVELDQENMSRISRMTLEDRRQTITGMECMATRANRDQSEFRQKPFIPSQPTQESGNINLTRAHIHEH